VEKINSRSNPICVHIKKLGKSKRYRDEQGVFLCDGIKLLDEALKSGVEIETVLFAREADYSLPPETRVYHVQESLIDSLSPLQSPQGVLFTCGMREVNVPDFSKGTHFLLDSIQDPGNVGTIIRCAHAFGVDSLILTEASADIYNPKTIRASMGAIFKQSIMYLDKEKICKLKESGVRFLGASNDSDSVNIKQVILNDSIIILGNEGQGISDGFKKLCSQMMKIPVSSDCESINVAAAASIIMWEASQKCHH